MKLNKKGFTLLELIIVIALIGVISAILIPKLQSVSESSKEKVIDIYNNENQKVYIDIETNQPIHESEIGNFKLVRFEIKDNTYFMYMKKEKTER